jgi:signal transduction histidine kinase
VLLNLLDNAVKYGPAGQTVTVSTARGSGGARVRLAVEDEGPGIPARDRARIFEPFQRLERPVEAAVTGNGIGLSVVRELVRAMGGVVFVDAAAARGARLVVELPVAAEAACGERPGRGTRHAAREDAVDLAAHVPTAVTRTVERHNGVPVP